jgi:hypothetical protein
MEGKSLGGHLSTRLWLTASRLRQRLAEQLVDIFFEKESKGSKEINTLIHFHIWMVRFTSLVVLVSSQ